MSDFMNNFQKTGFWNFGKIIDTKSCLELQKKIRKLRKLNKNIFYKSEKEFLKKGRFYKYAPGVNDHNLLISNELKNNLDFIEKNPKFIKNVSKILGRNYKIMKKSIIRSVPFSMIPKWLTKKMELHMAHNP